MAEQTSYNVPKVEQIVLDSKYPFKSHRYPNYIMFVKLSQNDKNDIIKHFRPIFPFSSPGNDVISHYIQNNSCGYCLQFGHTCKPHVFPPTCPNIEYDYLEWVTELSNKYEISETVLNYFVMTGIGFIHREKPSGMIPKWSSISAPQLSRHDFEKTLYGMKCEICNDFSHILDPCPKSDILSCLKELSAKL